MTKKDLTNIAKAHGAETICNKRNWAFYYIKESQIQSFLKSIIESKCSVHSNWDEEDQAFSVTVTLPKNHKS